MYTILAILMLSNVRRWVKLRLLKSHRISFWKKPILFSDLRILKNMLQIGDAKVSKLKFMHTLSKKKYFCNWTKGYCFMLCKKMLHFYWDTCCILMAAKPLICKSVLSNCMLMQNIAFIITSFQNLYLNNNHRQFSHHCVKAKERPKPPIIVSLSNINLTSK